MVGKKEWLRDRLSGYFGEHIMAKRIRTINEDALGLEDRKSTRTGKRLETKNQLIKLPENQTT